MKKKILVTGSNGLLGQKLVYKLRERDDVELVASSKGENRLNQRSGYRYVPLDITHEKEVQEVIAECRPDVLINPAAMTNVDACETKREECTAANVHALRFLVSALEKSAPRCQLIHLSTDFIFDGSKGSAYTEEDIPHPQSHYARSKWEGEKIVMNSKLKWAIARTIIVYGVTDNMSRSNLVLWVKNSLAKGERIKVITDQFRSPTLAEDLADGCIAIADKNASGIFNLSGPQTHSIWELAQMIAAYWKLDASLMIPVTSDELNQPAKRPLRTGFVLDKARQLLGYNPHTFAEGLKMVDEQIKLMQKA